MTTLDEVVHAVVIQQRAAQARTVAIAALFTVRGVKGRDGLVIRAEDVERNRHADVDAVVAVAIVTAAALIEQAVVH